MNKTIVLFVCSIFSATFISYARNDETPVHKGQIGITWSSFGNDVIIDFSKGGPGYSGDHFNIFGINYQYPLNNTLDFETGVEYSHHKIIIKPNVPYPSDLYNNLQPYGAKFLLISIPASIRINFARYFFINGGLFLGIDACNPMPVDSQTGIGANMGLGFKYNLKCGVTAFVNPYFKAHALVVFSPEGDHQHLAESGFRFGLMYRLN